jgi:translation initiation factor IF-2
MKDRHNHHPEHSRTASSSQTKWKRPIPFPMPGAGSERPFPRDSAPHRSKFPAHSIPSPSTAARSGRAARDTALPAETDLSTSEEWPVNEGNFESEVSSNYTRLALRESRERRFKIVHKERGSLSRAFRDDDLPSRNHSRDTPTKTHAQNSKPKGKLKALKGAQVEVFIPSTVSVGNLARILGVSLGRPLFVRQHSEFSLP